MEDLDKEMVEVKIVIEGGKHSEDETDNWVDHICVEMPTHPDLVKMYGAGRPNELRMLYLMNQQNLEIFSAYGDETPDEQKQQRRLVNAFKEVVEETNGNALVDIESSIIDEMNDRIDEGEFGIHDVDPHAIVRFMAEDYNRFRWENLAIRQNGMNIGIKFFMIHGVTMSILTLYARYFTKNIH